MSDDVTIEILRSIRDEIRGTNERIDSMSGRIDATNDRLEHLDKRQVQSEMRLATEIIAVVGAVNNLTDVLKEDRQMRGVVRDHEKRISALEKRVRR